MGIVDDGCWMVDSWILGMMDWLSHEEGKIIGAK
jgi:hypothetical protein